MTSDKTPPVDSAMQSAEHPHPPVSAGISTKPLSHAAAEQLLDTIKEAFSESTRLSNGAWQMMQTLHQRGGYRSLGYRSLNQLIAAELAAYIPAHRSTLYRWHQFFETLQNLTLDADADTPSQAAITEIAKVAPEQQQSVYDGAWDRARAAGRRSITSVDVVAQQVIEHPYCYDILEAAMIGGVVKSKAALKICRTLSECDPEIVEDLHGITDPQLIQMINRKRDTDTIQTEVLNPSVRGLYVHDGHNGDERFVSLNDLTPSLLRDELNRRSALHKEALKTGQTSTSGFYFPGDTSRQLRELEQHLSPDDLAKLATALYHEYGLRVAEKMAQ